ncbi:MAG: T9SS type A sorting domain-containing protein [Bacteroidetes bacterium]|nr:T9SS type A sorting domain-containing protein [Bacteroidota bacterium]
MKAMTLALLAAFAASSSGAQAPLTLDTTFRCTRFLNGGFHDAMPMADGTVLASGYAISVDNCCSNPFYSFFRIMPNGDLDESWSTNYGYGSIISSGDYYYLNIDGFPVRYFHGTGAIDQSFHPLLVNFAHPGLLHGDGGDVYVQPDGKVLCTGDHHVAEQWGINAPGSYSLLRVDTNGILDSTYQWRKTDGVIWTLVPTTQERFLISGVYNTYEGLPEGRILRIWPDGSLDSTFHTDIIKGIAVNLVEQPNGRILACGQFVFPNEPDTMHLIRLMPDGSLDTTFNNHAEYGKFSFTPEGNEVWYGANSVSTSDVGQLGNGTMLVSGNFTHIDGQQRRGIALLDTTGHLLNTALSGEGALLTHNVNSWYMTSWISAITQAPDGSIFLSGFFKGFDDGIVRDTNLTFLVKLHGLSTGIHEVSGPAWQAQLWPNPGMDELHIESTTKGKMDVRVYDVTGRVVLMATSSSNVLELNSANLGNGVYWVQVSVSSGRKTVKWVKE